MGENIMNWESHYKSLYGQIYIYYINQEMVDVTLVFKDGEIKAHKMILCAGSLYFQNIVKAKNVEHCKRINLESVSKKTMQYVLEFLYSGRVAVPNSDWQNVLDAADMYEVRGMISYCNDLNSSRDKPSTQTQENVSVQITSSKEKYAVFTENVGLRVSPVATSKRRLMRDLSIVQLPLRKNPAALKRKRILDEKKAESVTSTNVNSLPMNGAGIPDDSDSDMTNIEESQKPGPLVQENYHAESQNDSISKEVEIIDKEHSIVVIHDTENFTDVINQGLLRGHSSSKEKNDNPAPNRFDNFSSTDDDLGEPVHRKNKKTSRTIRRNISKISSDRKRTIGKRKRKKYEELLKRLPISKVDQFCVKCFTFQEDITDHIKIEHKVVPRKKLGCKKCLKQFFHSSFLNNGNHKCIEINTK